MRRRSFGPHKYQRLTDYLASLPAAQVTLTLAEVEAILGFALPPVAHDHSFWTNSTRGTFDMRPWVQAGWRVVRRDLHRATPTVTFAQVRSDSTA
jgi:hypothetical protein